jgi:multicomponent Na+:H+ antiporter subunit E
VYRSLLTRTAVLAGLWWIISRGETQAWLIGLPTVALAALASARLGRSSVPRLSLLGLVSFVALFLRESLRGGLDVACRTLTRRVRVQPGFTRYALNLSDPTARVLLINCISLLPGTLVTRVDGDQIELHLLDTGVDPGSALLRLERAIAGLYGLTLEPAHG